MKRRSALSAKKVYILRRRYALRSVGQQVPNIISNVSETADEAGCRGVLLTRGSVSSL
jgi:hypothetical protein